MKLNFHNLEQNQSIIQLQLVAEPGIIRHETWRAIAELWGNPVDGWLDVILVCLLLYIENRI